MGELAMQNLAEAIRTAIDGALDAGCDPKLIKEEIAYQVENYELWDAA